MRVMKQYCGICMKWYIDKVINEWYCDIKEWWTNVLMEWWHTGFMKWGNYSKMKLWNNVMIQSDNNKIEWGNDVKME